MRRLWPQARFAVAEEDLGNLPSGMRRCSRTSSALLNQRRWAIPVRPLLWVSKSLDKLAAALTGMGHAVSANSVRKLLCELGFSRQANRKAEEGSRHPDRNAQFDYTNAQALAAQAKPARYLRGYEEEGTGRQFSQRRRGLSAEGRSQTRQGPRLRGQETREGRTLRRLRHRGKQRLGQCGHHSRHGPIRRVGHSHLARENGAAALPEGARADN